MVPAFDIGGNAFVRSESVVSFGYEDREDNMVEENANGNSNETGASAETK